jgi:hypothetical protein
MCFLVSCLGRRPQSNTTFVIEFKITFCICLCLIYLKWRRWNLTWLKIRHMIYCGFTRFILRVVNKDKSTLKYSHTLALHFGTYFKRFALLQIIFTYIFFKLKDNVFLISLHKITTRFHVMWLFTERDQAKIKS